MQSFWVHQTDAKRKTVRLVILYAFFLAVFGAIMAFTITGIWDVLYPPQPERVWDGRRWVYDYTQPAYSYGRFFIILVLTPVFIWIMSLFSPASRGEGGKVIAESLDGTLVSPQTTDFKERRLLNVVEEMALASGIPVPPVYVLQNEAGINAFAAGSTVNNAVIGVTQGTLLYLNRDELQAVIAHEFSHILNQDMRINMRFACLLFGLMCISEIGKGLLQAVGKSRPRRSSGKNSGQGLLLVLVVALIFWLIGVLTYFFGTIIQAAVNRQREFLADASSVQFTRSPALADALKKIGGLTEGSALTEASMVGSYSHLFFCTAKSSLFDSHPPLKERIQRIDPHWDGAYPSVMPGQITESEKKSEKKIPSVARAVSGLAAAGYVLSWEDSGLDDVSKLASRPDSASGALDKLHAACHEPLDACYMIFGLLLDDNPAQRAKQIDSYENAEVKKRMLEYKEAFDLVDAEEYVPLIERAVPSLKLLSESQYKAFNEIMLLLIKADGVVSFKEWILYRLVESQVGAQYAKGRVSTRPGKAKFTEAAVTLLAAISQIDTDESLAESAFALSLQALGISKRKMTRTPSTGVLDESLRVVQLAPLDQRRAVIHGAVRAVAADQVVTSREAMFLRVLSLCLQVPLTREDWKNMEFVLMS